MWYTCLGKVKFLFLAEVKSRYKTEEEWNTTGVYTTLFHSITNTILEHGSIKTASELMPTIVK